MKIIPILDSNEEAGSVWEGLGLRRDPFYAENATFDRRPGEAAEPRRPALRTLDVQVG